MERYAIDLFDGHCDAVFLRYLSGGGLRRNDGHVDLERMGKYRRCAQFFALFGEPEPTPVRDLSGKTHRELFLEEYALFEREMAANADLAAFCRTGAEAEAAFRSGRRAAFLSVEGAELLDCSLERLEEAHAMGVRAVNPTWNHVNALSGTNAEEPERGLTPQGRAFVRKMERLGMLVDVSHLSDPGFWDVAEELSGPFFASHSNARAVFSHPRNLTDEQFTAIIDHNGVVGLNLYANFLGSGPTWTPPSPTWSTGWSWGASGPSLWAAIWTAVPACRRGSRVFRIWTGCGSGCCSGITVRRWCAPCFLRI